MYVLIIVVSVLSSAIPVGVTSQNIGRFDSLEQCKAVANKPGASGAVVDHKCLKRSLLGLRIFGAEVNATRHHVTQWRSRVL